MVVHIKRFDKNLPMPEYKSDGAAAIDLYARVTTVVQPRGIGYVPLNIALQLPPDHWALLSARSSLHKRSLLLANGVGIGDYDYRGDGDEYQAALLNFSDEKVIIERGERIVQLIVMARDKIQLVEKEVFDDPDRGGFGSTGR